MQDPRSEEYNTQLTVSTKFARNQTSATDNKKQKTTQNSNQPSKAKATLPVQKQIQFT